MFLQDWEERGLAQLIEDFEITEADLAGATVILATYLYENYSGDAFVLFERDGKLFEVNGSHCSCYGLGGQWQPEETSEAAIRARVADGALGCEWKGQPDIFGAKLIAELDAWARK